MAWHGPRESRELCLAGGVGGQLPGPVVPTWGHPYFWGSPLLALHVVPVHRPFLCPTESSPSFAGSAPQNAPQRSLAFVRSLRSLSFATLEEGVGCVHSPYSVVVGSFDPPLLFPFALLLPQWNPLSATDPFLFLLLRSFSTQNSSVPLPLVALTRETSDEPKSPS